MKNPTTFVPKDVNPIIVYDVEDKKPVLIFLSSTICGKYFDIERTHRFLSYVHKKTKMVKNKFNRTVCFRYPNAEQLKLLGNNLMVCLDERYKMPHLKLLVSPGFNKHKMDEKAAQTSIKPYNKNGNWAQTTPNNAMSKKDGSTYLQQDIEEVLKNAGFLDIMMGERVYRRSRKD